MAGPDPQQFAVHRAEVRPGIELAFLREGVGGHPLLLVHGWPETKRIWWRNVEPLARAGFEVIVPDLRGFGDSSLAPDGHYDLAAHARDLHALVHDTLGHASCAAAGGDLGGGVVQDMALRFDGFVERQVIFNSVLPIIPEAYARAGLAEVLPHEVRMAADYFVRQGHDADALATELDTQAQRVRYVEDFYGHRFWAAPGAFTREDAAFMAQPFGDPERLRASWGNYESAVGSRPLSEPPRFFETNPVPALVLYGPEDHVLWRDFTRRCEVVFTDLVGPFVVERAGHFLQWERADLFNRAVIAFLRDRLA